MGEESDEEARTRERRQQEPILDDFLQRSGAWAFGVSAGKVNHAVLEESEVSQSFAGAGPCGEMRKVGSAWVSARESSDCWPSERASE